MKIKEIEKVEDFEISFNRTLSTFLLNQFGQNYQIKWLKRNFFRQLFKPSEFWVCNANINAIYRPNMPSDNAEVVIGEYSNTPGRPIRSIFQKIYVRLCFTRYFSIFFATHILEISPQIPSSENYLIMGGLKKLRVINGSKKFVYLINKKNVQMNSLINEYNASAMHIHLKSPKLFEANLEQGWIQQEYFPGVPANRHDINWSSSVYESANILMEKYASSNSQIKSTSVYIKEKVSKIYQHLNYFEDQKITEKPKLIKRDVEKLGRTIVKNCDETIRQSSCHGDFHKGNVLASNVDFRIIDWEAADIRSHGYDLFTYLLSSRSLKGYGTRLHRVLRLISKSSVDPYCRIWFEGRSMLRSYFLLFLIEEVDFYLHECAQMKNKQYFKEYFKRHLKIQQCLLEYETGTNDCRLS